MLERTTEATVRKVGFNGLGVLLTLRGFFCFGLFQAGKAAGNCRAWLRAQDRDLLQQREVFLMARQELVF